MNSVCPCCNKQNNFKIIYEKENCPVMNNVTYSTEKDAKDCEVGKILLVECNCCGFVYNGIFDETLINYNGEYNNTRTFSCEYNKYLDDLVDKCLDKITEKDKILEIGCGNGVFLKNLCKKTGSNGFGYDKTYSGKTKEDNIVFIKEYFKPQDNKEKYNVLILRHVLEHIKFSYDFLKELSNENILNKNAMLVIEVPDFEWIVKESNFYDITYEHCNYFTKESLCFLIQSLGFEIISVENIFDGQYLLLKAKFLGQTKSKIYSDNSIEINDVEKQFKEKKQKYEIKINNAENICVWGMQGKGVVFINNFSAEIQKKINYLVDINPQKQGMFVPVLGKKIKSPEELKHIAGNLLVFVMNGIYKNEIKNSLEDLNVDAELYVA